MNDENCGVCLGPIKDTTLLDCEHCFCYKCIWTWCQHNNVCPLCKAIVTKFTTSIGYSLVCSPEQSYTEKIHEYLLYRDYVDDDIEIPNPRLESNLPGFVVSDSSVDYDESVSEDDDLHIYVKLTDRDKQPVSTRTRAKTRNFA